MISDTCSCGSQFSVTHKWINDERSSHSAWLSAHADCRARKPEEMWHHFHIERPMPDNPAPDLRSFENKSRTHFYVVNPITRDYQSKCEQCGEARDHANHFRDTDRSFSTNINLNEEYGSHGEPFIPDSLRVEVVKSRACCHTMAQWLDDPSSAVSALGYFSSLITYCPFCGVPTSRMRE